LLIDKGGALCYASIASVHPRLDALVVVDIQLTLCHTETATCVALWSSVQLNSAHMAVDAQPCHATQHRALGC